MITLTKQQEEVLRIMQEECAEVIQEASKVCRFGLDATHPDEIKTNQDKLTTELGDLQCMIDLALRFGIIDGPSLQAASRAKEKKLHLWTNIFKEELNDTGR